MGRLIAIIFAALFSAGLTALGYAWALNSALSDEAQRGTATLRLALDRLDARTERFRTLPFVITRFDALRLALQYRALRSDLEPVLSRIADASGARRAALLDRSGRELAHSGGPGVPKDVARARPSFQRALDGALGQYYATDPMSGTRSIAFEYPVQAADGQVLGVFLLHVDIEGLETTWRADRTVIYFTTSDGVAFIANRASLAGQPVVTGRDASGAFAPRSLEIWDGLPAALGAGPFLHLAQYNPRTGLTGHVLNDLSGAYARARLGALLGGLSGAITALLGALLFQRRQALRARLALKDAAARTLERRVQERTRDLSQANAQLKEEIHTRTRLQADLVQAEKLAALGEMSAGISHELNQPLAAIRSLADNGGTFLERGNADRAAGNFSRIAAMADRSGRILKNLRAFARNEEEPLSAVDLCAALRNTSQLLTDRLDRHGIALSLDLPEGQVWVIGGPVRLEQVLLNILSNAVDAISGSGAAHGRIDVNLSATEDPVTLRVTDTGPGLTAPDKVFDPFFTTKSVGDGLGLGLSLSYGLIQSFGGHMFARNHPAGGAEFEIRLPKAEKRDKAAP